MDLLWLPDLAVTAVGIGMFCALAIFVFDMNRQIIRREHAHDQ